jgi:hypothetical protein
MHLAHQIKTRSKGILSIAVAIISASLVTAFAFPQIAATRLSSFDTNNGRLKQQWVSFGRVYREDVEETEYSKLLKNLGIAEQPPEWRLANAEELGIRRWFFPQHVSYAHGKIAAHAYAFVQLVKLNEPAPAKAREEVERLRELIQKGNASEVKDYVVLLERNSTRK